MRKAQKAAATTAPTELTESPSPIADELFDRWLNLRTDRAHTPIGFTPVTALYQDFMDWHEADQPDAIVPTRLDFVIALRNAPRIKIETMLAQRTFERKGMTACANLTLRAPIRTAA